MHRLHRLLPRVALATSPLLAGGLAATKTPARSQSTATQKTLRVAVVQMLVGSDKATNLKNAERLVNQACDGHADVVVLPEIWNSPYAVDQFRKHAEPIGEACGPSVSLLKTLAKERNVWIVGGSVPELHEDKVYNTSPIINSDGVLVEKHRKVHLFDIDVPGKIRFFESETLTGGDSATVTPLTEEHALGVAICYDVRFPELAITMRKKGASILVYPGAFNTVTGPPHWELLARARALDAQAFVVCASPARNPDSSYQAYGHSVVVDPWGAPLERCAGHGEEILFADLDLTRVAEVRNSMKLLDQRRPDVYGTFIEGVDWKE